MPLLKKKAFERASPPQVLHDDEEVFYCEITGEIFRDYEEFSERMFLCNSMVWACEMTGKSNLTYIEALESEEAARKSLTDFPIELKIPMLFVATKTTRSAFGDMAEDVFSYMKDRYFVGELVEANVTDAKWKDAKIVDVIGPTTEQQLQNGSTTSERPLNPPANSYKYEVKIKDEIGDQNNGELMVFESVQIRRKRTIFSRDKCKLMLKLYVEQDKRGVFVIKQSIINEFQLNTVVFQRIFNGPVPTFDRSKKLEKFANGKKMKQETLTRFLKKMDSENNIFRQDIKKLFDAKVAISMRNWYKPKEDLELEDHKKLPVPTPIKLQIPNEYLADVFMIMEFVHSFSKFLAIKEYFPSGLTVDVMERAMTIEEVAGPLVGIVQMLLVAIFSLQDEEASHCNANFENVSDLQKDVISHNITLDEATQGATLCAHWCYRHYGISLSKLPFNVLTTTEILRLHLVSSGARINDAGTKWRLYQRAGYSNREDPGLDFCINEHRIIKALSKQHIVQLSIIDKIKIVSCLMHQILTYGSVRTHIEDGIEQSKQAKIALKNLQLVKKKNEQEFDSKKMHLRKEEKDPMILTQQLDALQRKYQKQNVDKGINQLAKVAFSTQTILGQDRAFRKYMMFESVPGLFICTDDDNNAGICLNQTVKQYPNLVNGDRVDVLEHIKKTIRDINTSNKENDPEKTSKINDTNNSITKGDDDGNDLNQNDVLMICSADPHNCIVHSNKSPNWGFFYNKDDIDELINNLNERGIRENELKQVLEGAKSNLLYLISRTPVTMLNNDIDPIELPKLNQPRRLLIKFNSNNVNLGYSLEMATNDILESAVLDTILDFEHRIHSAAIGTLTVENRDEWHRMLKGKDYDGFNQIVINEQNLLDMQTIRPDTPMDPSHFFTRLNNGNCEFNTTTTTTTNNLPAIRTLAIALNHVASTIEPQFLRKPLGRVGGAKHDKKQKIGSGLFLQWQQSLLASTSFSQIFLHYGILDSCVMWLRSILYAKCGVCKKSNNPNCILLCDYCNLGYHYYCLTPKLKGVPEGDWYCNKCVDFKKQETPPPPPEKKVTTFSDEELVSNNEDEEKEEVDDDDDDDDNHHEEKDVINYRESSTSDKETDEESGIWGSNIDEEVCKTCSQSGDLLRCIKCCDNYHYECVDPPLKRPPRGSWICLYCKDRMERRHRDSDWDWRENSVGVQRTGLVNGQRRCAAKARYKIHNFAKSLRDLSESDGDFTDDSDNDEIINKRSSSHRRDEGRTDLPLHNAALHELLSDVMKDNCAWPFLRPVQKTEVPDYYDVITKPMDFGTIKYKLNMGEYKEDAELMADAVLIFQNCNTYNHTEDDVYKCGVQLLKHFQRKTRDLGLQLPRDMDYYSDDSETPKKKRRTKL